jgi:hypothetical protein
MTSTLRRVVRPALVLPLVVCLASCGAEEREQLRADLQKSKEAETRLTAQVADLAKKSDDADRAAADLKHDVGRLHDEVAVATAASDQMKHRRGHGGPREGEVRRGDARKGLRRGREPP